MKLMELMKSRKNRIIALVILVVIVSAFSGGSQKKESERQVKKPEINTISTETVVPPVETVAPTAEKVQVDQESLDRVKKAIVKQGQASFGDSVNFNCEVTSSTDKNGECSISVSITTDSKDLTDGFSQLSPNNTTYINLKKSIVGCNKSLKKLVSDYTNVDQDHIYVSYAILNSYNLERYLLWYINDTLVYSVVEN